MEVTWLCAYTHGLDHLIIRAQHINLKGVDLKGGSLLRCCESQEAFDRILYDMGTGTISLYPSQYKFITLSNVATICSRLFSPYYTIPDIVEELREIRPEISHAIIATIEHPHIAFFRNDPLGITVDKYRWYTDPAHPKAFREFYKSEAIRYIHHYLYAYIPTRMDLLEHVYAETGEKFFIHERLFMDCIDKWPQLKEPLQNITTMGPTCPQ